MAKLKATGQVKIVQDRYSLSKEYVQPFFSNFNNYEDLYRCQITASKGYRAQVFDPKTFAAVEKIVPRMVANKPRGEFKPRELSDIAASRVLGEVFEYDWDKADMFHKMVDLVKTAMIFGTAIGKVPYKYERRKVRYSKPLIKFGSLQFGNQEKEKMKVCYDGPSFEVCNIYDCFPDPQANGIRDSRWFIHRTYPTIEELKNVNDAGREENGFKNLDKLEEMIKDGTDYMEDSFRGKSRSIAGSTDYTGRDRTVENFEMVTMYTPERWVSIAPKYNLLLRDIPNPYYHGKLPFVKLNDYPLPNEWFGRGEIEPIERLQRAVNQVINQRLDNVNMILNTGWKVDTTGGVDLSSLVSRPGMIIKTRRMDAVDRIDVPDVTSRAFSDTYSFLQASISDSLGVNDYTVRTNQATPTGQKTATGLRLTQEEANSRFNLKIQLFEEEVIKEIAEQWIGLRQQFLTRPMMMRVASKESVEFFENEAGFAEKEVLTPNGYQPKMQGDFLFVEPNDIAGEYDFIPEAGSTRMSDPLQERLAFVEMLGMLEKMRVEEKLQANGQSLAWDKILDELFEKYGIKGGADRFTQQMDNQLLQAQGGQNGQIGPNGAAIAQGAPGNAGQGYQVRPEVGQNSGIPGMAGY